MVTRVKDFWCNKIIPLVYDDSLSYYEAVCKLTDKINELIEFTNTVLEQKLTDFILSVFNKIMIDVMYDEPSETIIFYLNKEGAEENV